jgi:chaperonin GroES
MKLKPLSNNILVEYIEDNEKTTKSGIVLPENVEKKERTKGTVVATGPGKINDSGTLLPISVKVGDVVLFSKPWSDEKKLEEGGKKYYIVSEEDVLGIIE